MPFSPHNNKHSILILESSQLAQQGKLSWSWLVARFSTGIWLKKLQRRCTDTCMAVAFPILLPINTDMNIHECITYLNIYNNKKNSEWKWVVCIWISCSELFTMTSNILNGALAFQHWKYHRSKDQVMYYTTFIFAISQTFCGLIIM